MPPCKFNPFKFKVSIVGCGNVGATGAYAMLLDGRPTHLTLIDLCKERVEGLMLDMEHTLAFVDYTELKASNNIEDCKDSNVIFITAGVPQKPGQPRLELIETNRKIFKTLIPAIVKAAPQAILVIVTNPVDVLTYEAIKLAKLPKGRVFGTGTMLDTARFQFHIGEKLNISPQSVEAYILGEHGDSSFPVYSSAQVGGKRLLDFPGLGKRGMEVCYKTTRDAAYNIIHDIGYTCYSIGVVMRQIMKHIFEDSRIVVPLSQKIDGYYGVKDVCLSVPCVLGANGIERTIDIPLDGAEQKKLKQCAELLKGYQKGK